MNICFINNIYEKEVRGGAERTIRNLVDYLETRGHSITVIERSSQYHRLTSLPKWRRFINHAFGFINFSAYFKLKDEIAQGNFDLVWAHNLTGFGLLAVSALGNSKKIFTFHDIQYLHPSGLLMYGEEKKLDSLIARIYQAIGRRLFPKDAVVIFPSQWLASVYAQYAFAADNKQLVLTNPIEQPDKVERKSSGLYTFLFLGQIENHKGVPLLLRAFSELKDLPARLIIAGSGSLSEALARKNSDKRIFFTGPYENPYQQLAQADCLVIPSTCYENLPTVAMEAAIAKVPVIASRLGGSKELINDDSLLFNPLLSDLKASLEWACLNQDELIKKADFGRSQLRFLAIETYLKIIGERAGVTF